MSSRRPMHKAVEEAFGPFVDFCSTCLGPNLRAPMVVLLRTGQQLPRCPDCGRRTNTEGKSLVRAGTDPGRLKIIYLEHPEGVS